LVRSTKTPSLPAGIGGHPLGVDGEGVPVGGVPVGGAAQEAAEAGVADGRLVPAPELAGEGVEDRRPGRGVLGGTLLVATGDVAPPTDLHRLGLELGLPVLGTRHHQRDHGAVVLDHRAGLAQAPLAHAEQVVHAGGLEGGDRLGRDHAAVGHQADPPGAGAGAQALGHGHQAAGDVDGVAGGPEAGAERPVGAVQHDAEDDLARLRPVILRVAVPAEAAALALEPERGGAEEGDADRAEPLTPMREQGFLDQPGAGPAALGLPTEPGDRLVEPAQADVLGAGDAAVPRPGLGMAIRAGDDPSRRP
jgi:hypothetical protein